MILNSAFERGDYDWLYANYLDESHGLLKEAVQALPNEGIETAVDLCAGTGVMTLQLLSMDISRVFAVDASEPLLSLLKRKIVAAGLGLYAVDFVTADLNRREAMPFLKGLLPRSSDYRADLITCRQGVGYLNKETLVAIPDLLREGGNFVFNSFVEPKRTPWLRRKDDGITEAGFYAFGRVVHLQARWPRVDLTSFAWHDVEGTLKPLWERKGFRVKITKHNRTLIVRVLRPFEH
jgi:SAM-dependent methyltransferase